MPQKRKSYCKIFKYDDLIRHVASGARVILAPQTLIFLTIFLNTPTPPLSSPTDNYYDLIKVNNAWYELLNYLNYIDLFLSLWTSRHNFDVIYIIKEDDTSFNFPFKGIIHYFKAEFRIWMFKNEG